MKHRARPLASSEAEAIERAKQGDAEAFALLYGLHKRRVYSLCLRMTANSAEAEDLTQEAFLQLFRKIATFRGESAFSTWLHRMAVNVVLMQLRKKSLPVVPLDDTQENEEETPRKELGAQDPVLSGTIDRLRLQRAVEALPPGYRRIFVLHDVEGYEHNEIATMLGCSIGNSKSQLHKSKMGLGQSLKTRRAEKATKQYWRKRGGRGGSLGNFCRKGIDALVQHPRLLGSFRDDTVLRRGTCGERSPAARS